MLVTLFYDFMGSPLPTRGQCIHRALHTRCVLLSFSSSMIPIPNSSELSFN